MEEVKKTKKKNKVASLLLALALILTCGVAGTIAQYQKSLGGHDTANVANFNVSSDTLGKSTSDEIGIFDNILESDGQTSESHTSNKVAPGTSGKFDINLTNESEVNVDCNLTVSLKTGTGSMVNYYDTATTSYLTKNIPLQFALVDASTVTSMPTSGDSAWVSIDDLSTKLKSKNYSVANGKSNPTKLTLYWKWEMGSDTTTAQNDLDTAIGEIMRYYQTGNSTVTVPSGTATNDIPSSLKSYSKFTLPDVIVEARFVQVHK